MKKHNLFEDNLNLPCESVSSLTDLKTPSGSAQTTPAKKPSTARAEVSDTDTQGDETLVVTGKISWEKDADDRKSSDKEAVGSVGAAGDQASEREEAVVTDAGGKQESRSAALPKQDKKSTLESADTGKAEGVVGAEKELKTQEVVEEKVAFGPEAAVQDFGAGSKQELQVHEEVEEKVTSESRTATDAAFFCGTENKSKAQEEGSEIEPTSPHNNAAEAGIVGNAEKKVKVEEEMMERLSQSENAVGREFEEDSKKESNDQEASTETRVVSQDENTGKGGFGANPEKESKSEEESCKSPDDVNEIRSLLTVTVEIPADTPAENIKEICEGEILKLQEHYKGDNETSQMAVAGIQVSQTLVNTGAAECVEFKEDQPSPSCLGTDGMDLVNESEGACDAAQAQMENSDTAGVEVKQSVCYAGVESCKNDRSQPEEHTENGSAGERLDGEGRGAGGSHAVLVEVGTESFLRDPAENGDAMPVPVLDTENPRTGLRDVAVSRVLERGEVSAADVPGDPQAGEGAEQPEGESSSHTEIKSTDVKAVLTEENREDSYTQQKSEE